MAAIRSSEMPIFYEEVSNLIKSANAIFIQLQKLL